MDFVRKVTRKNMMWLELVPTRGCLTKRSREPWREVRGRAKRTAGCCLDFWIQSKISPPNETRRRKRRARKAGMITWAYFVTTNWFVRLPPILKNCKPFYGSKKRIIEKRYRIFKILKTKNSKTTLRFLQLKFFKN